MYDVVLASYDAETIYPVVQKLFGGQKFAEYPFYLLFLFSFFIFLFLFSFSFFFSLCFDTTRIHHILRSTMERELCRPSSRACGLVQIKVSKVSCQVECAW